jgi:sulfite reductase beta subunit-like hemoprotein
MMAKVEITYELAMAAARDAGNRSMREGRRTKWAVKDWNVACETFARLYGTPKATPVGENVTERDCASVAGIREDDRNG